jgi:hypothetical protein
MAFKHEQVSTGGYAGEWPNENDFSTSGDSVAVHT